MRLTVGLALTLAIMTCGAQARDMQSIEHSGELKVGVPGDYAPLAFRNAAGELQGYDVDMARDLGRTLGLKVSFVYTSWPALAADLQADKFDIAMGGVTETPARAQAFALSHPVVANGKIALANCQAAPRLGSLEKIDRPDVKVVVNPGGTNQSFVDEHIKQAQIIRVQNNVDNLQALLSKNIGAQLEIAPAAQIIVDKSRGRLAISSTRLVYPLPLGIYVAKGNTELAEAIKATLATLKANGQYAALIKKYNLESID